MDFGECFRRNRKVAKIVTKSMTKWAVLEWEEQMICEKEFRNIFKFTDCINPC